jgi:aldose 1-epimerase
MMHEAITLHCDAAVCEVFPSLGGSLGSWRVGTQDMLRRASEPDIAASNPLGMASFPLVPYSNRIGNARFDWNGKSFAIKPNFAPEPHAIHGIGWTRPWTIAAQTVDSITLTLDTDADDEWPWPFRAKQHIVLGADRLTLYLSAVNMADTNVALAFGHHPYFDAEGATLQFAAERVWMSGPDALPCEAVVPAHSFDFSMPVPIAGRSVDHCFTGVSATTKIVWADRHYGLDISASALLPAAVVYIPESGDAFCYEPVPHLNNALNMSDCEASMPSVAPNESFCSRIDFVVRPRE